MAAELLAFDPTGVRVVPAVPALAQVCARLAGEDPEVPILLGGRVAASLWVANPAGRRRARLRSFFLLPRVILAGGQNHSQVISIHP